MPIDPTLLLRAGNACELCVNTESLCAYDVTPDTGAPTEHTAVLCETCVGQIESNDLDTDHWQCLSTSMWSQSPVCASFGMAAFKSVKAEKTWAQDLLDMMYLDESLTEWAEAGLPRNRR